MIFTSPETLLVHLKELGTHGNHPEAPMKKLTLWDATWQAHFISDLDTHLSEPEFLGHLARVFRRPRGGHLVVRLPQRAHLCGRSGQFRSLPDRVCLFLISSGRAQPLSARDVLVTLGRLSPGEAQSFGRPAWRERKPQPEAVSA